MTAVFPFRGCTMRTHPGTTTSFMETWLIKIGSNAIQSGGVELLARLMGQVKRLQERKISVTWLTSGARALGRAHVPCTASRKMACAVGQGILIGWYNQALAINDLPPCGQVLPQSYHFQRTADEESLRSIIDELVSHGNLPVVNENDALSTTAAFNDNDRLAFCLARVVEADRVVFLSDVGGLYSSNPKRNKNACLIPVVRGLTSEIVESCSEERSSIGTGGMISKVEMLMMIAKDRCDGWLAPAAEDDVLIKIADGKEVGTKFTCG